MITKVKNVHVFRIPANKDIMEYLKNYVEENEIKCGAINVIGALKNADIGYYSTGQKRYIREYVDEQCEILSGLGNIFRIGGEYFVHFHIVLGRRDFWVKGGHLIRGKVFVAEVIIYEFEGECPRIKKDLSLWPEDM